VRNHLQAGPGKPAELIEIPKGIEECGSPGIAATGRVGGLGHPHRLSRRKFVPERLVIHASLVRARQPRFRKRGNRENSKESVGAWAAAGWIPASAAIATPIPTLNPLDLVIAVIPELASSPRCADSALRFGLVPGIIMMGAKGVPSCSYIRRIPWKGLSR